MIKETIMERSKVNLGYLEGWISSALNILLFILKLWAGVAISSIAMIADAWHTLSDTLTSLVVIVGFTIAGKPKDKEHPFGHGRAEVIGALIIGIILGVVGVNFLKESAHNLLRRSATPSFTLFPILIFTASAVLKESLAQFAFWAGRRISSRALIGDGWHHRSDAIASLLIVAGALLGKKLWWIDGVMGLGVSLLILWAAFDVVRKSADDLMGREVTDELAKSIREICKKTSPEITGIHHLHVHGYGDHRELTLHVRLGGERTLVDTHAIASSIEKALRESLNLEATVHTEPHHISRKHT